MSMLTVSGCRGCPIWDGWKYVGKNTGQLKRHW